MSVELEGQYSTVEELETRLAHVEQTTVICCMHDAAEYAHLKSLVDE